MLTVVGNHLISALHGADLGGHDRAAAVSVALAHVDQGLLANDARTANLFDMSVAIGDHPVP
ncbi:hypothetical protein D3C75_1241760 [compost metagenome]